MPEFVFDHSTFTANSAEELEQYVETLVEVIDLLADQRFVKSPEAYYKIIFNGFDLLTILYDEDQSPLDSDGRKALIENINRIPDDVDGDLPTYLEGIVLQNIAVGLVTVNDKIPPVVVHNYVIRIVDEVSLLKFFRAVFAIENIQEQQFHALAVKAFPLLYLNREKTRFNKFSHPYAETCPLVVKHLAAINDDFRRLSSEFQGNTDIIIAHFAGAPHDIRISPESPQTHNYHRAMKDRTVMINSIEYLCEWHSKLYWDTDRIHFCATENRELGGKIVIGMFASHLAT